MAKINFEEFANSLIKEGNLHMLAPVIKKELLHYEILLALANDGLLKNLVFQGGTALRLCYGSPRYSEDLDFAGGQNFSASNLGDLKECLVKALSKRYDIEAKVKEPKQLTAAKGESLVVKWQISINTEPARPDLPAQRIKLEVAAVPAYSRELQVLKLNYPELPASYSDILIPCESLEEIMADKLESFICSPQLRYRDIWDLFWLMRRPQMDFAQVALMRRQKEDDYGEAEAFRRGRDRAESKLEEIINSKGSYYAYGRHGLIVVSPGKKLVLLMH